MTSYHKLPLGSAVAGGPSRLRPFSAFPFLPEGHRRDSLTGERPRLLGREANPCP